MWHKLKIREMDRKYRLLLSVSTLIICLSFFSRASGEDSVAVIRKSLLESAKVFFGNQPRGSELCESVAEAFIGPTIREGGWDWEEASGAAKEAFVRAEQGEIMRNIGNLTNSGRDRRPIPPFNLLLQPDCPLNLKPVLPHPRSFGIFYPKRPQKISFGNL